MTSTISGNLYFDNNADSQRESGAGEGPWYGATVQLYSADGTTPVGSAVKTDSNGNYSIPDVPKGTYTLLFKTGLGARADQGYVDANGYSLVPGITTDGTSPKTVDQGFYLAASVGGVVDGSSGQGADGVTLNLVDSHGNTVATTTGQSLESGVDVRWWLCRWAGV